MRGLSQRGRSFVGLIFVAIAIVLFGIFLRAYEIANGTPFLKSPKAEDGPFALLGIFVVIVIPYVIGKLVGRLIWRSKVRFYRSYRHQ